jgi:hypothetical protein
MGHVHISLSIIVRANRSFALSCFYNFYAMNVYLSNTPGLSNESVDVFSVSKPCFLSQSRIVNRQLQQMLLTELRRTAQPRLKSAQHATGTSEVYTTLHRYGDARASSTPAYWRTKTAHQEATST